MANQKNNNKINLRSNTVIGWITIILLLVIVVLACICVFDKKADEARPLKDISNTTQLKNISDTTQKDSTAFMQRVDVELLVEKSTQETLNTYIDAQSNFLTLVGILVAIIAVLVPIIIGNSFQKINEDWNNKRIEAAEKEIKEKLEKIEQSKKEVEENKNKAELQVQTVVRQSKEITTLKNNLVRFISNYELEIRYKESVQDTETKGSRKEKIEYLEGEIKKHNTSYPASSYYELGKLYFEENVFDKAVEKFEEAIERNPDHADAYQSLAETYLKQAENEPDEEEYKKKLKQLWREIEKALSFAPKNIRMLEIRCKVFFNLGMFSNAEKDAIRCVVLAREEEKESYKELLKDIRNQNKVMNDKKITIAVNGVEFDMIKVEGGAFSMGSSVGDGDADEQPVHQVLLDDYYIGETVVTQELWESVMGNNPSGFKGKKYPVETVSWNDVRDFVDCLNHNTKNSRPEGTIFCLPTEAQWEFAARGGNLNEDNYKYSGSNFLDEVAYYWQNSGNHFLEGDPSDWNCEVVNNNNCKTHPVKAKKGNELGLYDMSGNVWEWCQDWYGMYSNEPQINPPGCNEEKYRVARGGSWFKLSKFCRVSYRMSFNPGIRKNNIGFRLALVYYSSK